MDLEKRISDIEERNRRVEQDKAWETSWVRISTIAVFTYVTVGLFLYLIGIVRPWLNAIVPALGFVLSTLTLPLAKKIWLKRNP